MNGQIQWLKWVRELKAIAQNGLTYCHDEFDRERYTHLMQLAAEIAAEHTHYDKQALTNLFLEEVGYATPKVDVRGVVFRDNKILLVLERADNLWTLPGGFADVNESAGEAVVREIFEESGFETKVIKLLALYDGQKKNNYLPQVTHGYKCFFQCEIIGGAPSTSIETAEVKFFAENELPELSKNRVVATQIQRFFQHLREPELPTDFD